MSTTAAAASAPASSHAARPQLDTKPGPLTTLVFLGLLAAGLFFAAYSLVADVQDAGVQTKVHYGALHRQPLFAPFTDGAGCPNADAISAHVLSLPMYPELTDEEVLFIARAVCRSLGAVQHVR